MKRNILKDKEIVIGICGGISAYKIPELIRLFKKNQAKVSCILTESAKNFVTPLTLKILSQNEVYSDMFAEYTFDIEHISLAEKADVVVVAPCSCNTLAKLATGKAEDLLSCVVIATKAPVLLCPSMNENMFKYKATQENIEKLKSYGFHIMLPEKGELACNKIGIGRLPDINKIFEKVKEILQK